MKRLWDHAAVVARGGEWIVALDGEPVRVPGGAALSLQTAELADAVAEEWRRAGTGARGTAISFADLPLTRVAGTAQERVAPDPRPVARELARYGESDLLCYRAERPEGLIARERALWDPWIEWAARRHGAQLRTTAGVVHVPQDPMALGAILRAVEALPAGALAALGVAVPALGSVVLGLAMADGALDAATAHDLAMVGEMYQAEQWGADDEAIAHRARVRGDVLIAGRYLELIGP